MKTFSLVALFAISIATMVRADLPIPAPVEVIVNTVPTDQSAIPPAESAVSAGPANQTAAEPASPLLVLEDTDCPRVAKCWLRVGFDLFFISPSRMPPLVTTGTVASGGILGAPGATPLIATDVNYHTLLGFTINGGVWLDCDYTWGLEGSTTWLNPRSKDYTATSNGSTLLTRPIVNALTGAPAVAVIATPGFVAGNIVVHDRVNFETSDGHLMYNVYRDDRTSISALLGLRYLYFRESTHITENQQFLTAGFGNFVGSALPALATQTIVDEFQTFNNILAGQMGMNFETVRDCIRISATAKVGLGWNHERILGSGTTSSGGVTVPGGILAQSPSFPYRSGFDTFVVIPELIGRVGYQITPRLCVYASYDFLFVNNVARPGAQIDRSVNPLVVPSFQTFVGTGLAPSRPTPTFTQVDLFVHGITLGVDFKY